MGVGHHDWYEDMHEELYTVGICYFKKLEELKDIYKKIQTPLKKVLK